MNIEEKAKAYDEAIIKVKALYGQPLVDNTLLETIFPELKESEDEKVRKEIISFIQDDIDEINLKVSGDYDDRDEDDIAHQIWCKKAISWLENIPYTIDHEKREGFHLGYKAGLEKQVTSYTKKDVDDAYIEGMVFTKNELEKQGEQKPAWSIKEKLMLNDIIETTERSNIFKENYQRELIDWLKSIKERYTWKPSIAQLNALSIVSKGNAPDDIEAIVSLYNDLKKLTE